MDHAGTATGAWSLLGRILLAPLFLVSGTRKILAFGPTALSMATKDLPYVQVLLVLTIAIEVGGALMILLGWRTRFAAAVLFLWLAPVTYLYHAFWGLGPAEMQNQLNHFLKNVALMGALAQLVAFGPGPWSFGGGSRRRSKR
jgi:putative oxidoreductase